MANPLICVFNPITTLIDEIPASSIFTGAGAAGTPVVLNSQGFIDPSLFGAGTSATAGELLVAGALINLYNSGGNLFMQNAYAAATGTSPSGAPYPVPAVGFVSNNVSISNTALVQFSGFFTYADTHSEFSASSIGKPVYLSTITPGGITLTQPSGVGQLQQYVGNVVGFTLPNLVNVVFLANPPAASFNQFNNIATGTNTTATMTVGSGATLQFSGSGVVNANQVYGVTVSATAPTVGQVLTATSATTADWENASFLAAFNGITSGTNTTATMTVGSGGTLTFTGSGVVNANELFGVVISSTPPTTGQVLTATSGVAANWQTPSGGGTPGGSPTQLQFNSAGTFAGASNSAVSGTGAITLGNTSNAGVSTTALTVNASGGIAVSATDWYSSNEGTVVASMLTSGRLTLNGVNIISNVSIGAVPALTVIGGNAGSPDIADFTTAIGATPSSTKTIWIDYNGNLNLGGGGGGGIKDSTGSLGTSGQVLSSTGTQTLWAAASGGPVTRTVRFNAGSIASGALSTMQVVNFSTAFADNNYTAAISLELGENVSVAGVTVSGFTKQAAGVGVNVWFLNNDNITHNVTIHVIAEHD
jgi:hypothetical protein